MISSNLDLSGYTWRYVLNAALVLLTILAVVENVVMTMSITGAWLGLSDVVWHWVLLALSIATALNTALNHTPPITAPPTAARVQTENQVAQIRKAA